MGSGTEEEKEGARIWAEWREEIILEGRQGSRYGEVTLEEGEFQGSGINPEGSQDLSEVPID